MMMMMMSQDWTAKGRENEKNLQLAIQEHNKAERCCRVIMSRTFFWVNGCMYFIRDTGTIDRHMTYGTKDREGEQQHR